MRFDELCDTLETYRHGIIWSTVPDGVLRGESLDGRAHSVFTWACRATHAKPFNPTDDLRAAGYLRFARATYYKIQSAVENRPHHSVFHRWRLLAACGIYEGTLHTWEVQAGVWLRFHMKGYHDAEVRLRLERMLQHAIASIDPRPCVHSMSCAIDENPAAATVMPFREAPPFQVRVRPVREVTIAAPER